MIIEVTVEVEVEDTPDGPKYAAWAARTCVEGCMKAGFDNAVIAEDCPNVKSFEVLFRTTAKRD